MAEEKSTSFLKTTRLQPMGVSDYDTG